MKINNSLGLSVELLENGIIKSIVADPIRVGLRNVSIYAKPLSNIFLRKISSNNIEFIPLWGPESPSQYYISNNAFKAEGTWMSVNYSCILTLSEKSLSWQWQIDIVNNSEQDFKFDLIYLQDVGLKPATETSINEYYVSQYTERLILNDKTFGKVVCCRQNMKGPTGNPWLMLACKNATESACTDGMQFYGNRYRVTGIPEALKIKNLGGEYAGESSIVALQAKPLYLKGNENHSVTFIGYYLHNHPTATNPDDLLPLSSIFDEFKDIKQTPIFDSFSPQFNIFNTSPLLPVKDLNGNEIDALFKGEKRHVEIANKKVISFFYGKNNHVALKEKEMLVDRPHGHIMQANCSFSPNESIVSTTSFAYGVFNSHLTQGNTNFNTFLSVTSSQFNLAKHTGQRIFVEIDKQKYLLGVPSAFEMGLNFCRWIYKHSKYVIQVRTWTSIGNPQVNLDIKELNNLKLKFIITNHLDEENCWEIDKAAHNEIVSKSGNANSLLRNKFPNAQFRMYIQSQDANYEILDSSYLHPFSQENNDSFIILKVDNTNSFTLSFIGEVTQKFNAIPIENPDYQFNSDNSEAQKQWKKFSLNLTLNSTNKSVQKLQDILPWFGTDALIHFLTPYGLEQFSGAAWGTRDVAQGPLELLLNLGHYKEAKEVLLTIFSNQHFNGEWPQWWMFDSYSSIRANEAHGDVVYWPIIALSNYIKATSDTSILNEEIPYYLNNEEFGSKATLREHLNKLTNLITNSYIKNTSLVPFGGGDWNDSLQPVSKDLAQRMISSWTVEMNFQAFKQLQQIFEFIGNKQKVQELSNICDRIKSDFYKYLVKDNIVAGYGLVNDNGSISQMLHPTDTKTGIKYSILPINRGIISEIFTKDLAQQHQSIIKKHLTGPDGIRLMDQPLKYKGGIQTIFQRAESSTFFGREIGLMYIHEHIRYAETQAIIGNAPQFFNALMKVIPISYNDEVPCADLRQNNCYYSSSDAIFNSRYDANKRYNDLIKGKMPLKGGWRVYSSGPGIFIGIVISRFLGIRSEFENTIIDPVIPKSLNGLKVLINYKGFKLEISYKIVKDEYNPKEITINQNPISITFENNPYRAGGAKISTNVFLSYLTKPINTLEITL
ncbi:MAG TPA: amylo-alpha-1,6-glucosidase [Tenuifilaceae bacterium]|nr:amylo-alpha-1,6-glucosidase [Tenuifilaceae bacterium]